MFQELLFKRVRILYTCDVYVIITMRKKIPVRFSLVVAPTCIAKISEFSPKYFHIFGSPSVHRIPRFNMLSLIYHMCCLYKLYTGVSRRLVINHAKRILQNETGYCPKA